MRPVVLALLVLAAVPAGAQEPARPETAADRAAQPAAQFDTRVDVVGVTPIHGLGLSRLRIPANVQVFTIERTASAPDLASMLAGRATSVHLVDAQGGAFQPDLLFRGFSGSPLLGASEGLAVYQDGVRINEAFGDTVNWDAIPTGAIASINLMPGSNPLFGLNALGGALSLRTKDGFAFPGGRASLSTGSFGRHHVQAEVGGHGSSFGYFLAGSVTDEEGWRDHSPSAIRRLFGDVAWREDGSTINLSLTAASNDLTGNGAAPVRLLDDDRRAVFTHPDRTDNDLALVTLRGGRVRGTTLVDAVAYYRHTRIGTFNGDAADDDDDDDEDGNGDEEEGDEEDAGLTLDAVNNISRTRGRAAGGTLQVTRTASVLGRENHLIAGAGVDAALSRFDFAAELATLRPDRGTIGSGLFDEDASVDLDTRTTTGSAFATNTWSPSARVSLTGSARFNWTSVTLRDRLGTALNGEHRFARVNPAAGLTVQVRPALNVFGSYAQSSRVPTPVELTCADPGDPCRLPNAFVSDPPLDQIVAATWEAGLRGTPGRLSWGLSFYRTSAADDIIFVSSGTLRGEGHFENVARTLRAGMEGSVEYRAGDRLSAFASYALQRATFGTNLLIASPFHPLAEGAEIEVRRGDRLPGVPTHSARAGLEGAIGSRLRVGVSLRAQSGQYHRGDEGNLLPPVPGFIILDAQVRQRILGRLTLVADMQNLLDAEYSTFGVLGEADLLGGEFDDEPRFSTPGAPRAAWIGLEVRF